jgi:hypothetical protein
MLYNKIMKFLSYINLYIFNNNNNNIINSNFTNFTYIPDYLYTNKKLNNELNNKSNNKYYNIILDNNVSLENDICIICMNEIYINENMNIVSLNNCNCKYEYHKKCIDIWLNKNLNCPLCRKEVCSKEVCRKEVL